MEPCITLVCRLTSQLNCCSTIINIQTLFSESSTIFQLWDAMLCCVGFKFIFSTFQTHVLKIVLIKLHYERTCMYICLFSGQKKNGIGFVWFCIFHVGERWYPTSKTSLCSKFENAVDSAWIGNAFNERVFDSQCIGCLRSIVQVCACVCVNDCT